MQGEQRITGPIVQQAIAHPSPNQEPTNSELKLVCGDWHPSENTGHPTHFLFHL